MSKTTTIGELLPRAVTSVPQQSQPKWPHLEPQKKELLNTHSDLKAFMRSMNPDMQLAYGKDPDHAFRCSAPALCVLDAAYGEGSAVLWLMPQIFALGEYVGARIKMDENQVADLAKTIRIEFGNYKTSELCLFFYRFRSAAYGDEGKLYSSVDPMVITRALRKYFSEEHGRAMKAIANEKLEAEKAEELRRNPVRGRKALELYKQSLKQHEN